MARTKQTARKRELPSAEEIKSLKQTRDHCRDIIAKQTRDHCRDVIVKRKNIYKEDYIVKRKRPSIPEEPQATCLPGGGWIRASTPPPSPKAILKQELADAKLEIQALRQEVRDAGQRQDVVKKEIRKIYQLAHAVDDDIKSLEKREALRAVLDTEEDLVSMLSGSVTV